MFLTAHNRIFVLSTICALFFLSALPLVARSQEENLDANIIEEVVNDEVVLPVTTVITKPYQTETLLGDKVIGDFVLGPGKIELEINPGESKTVEITVSNRIGEPHIFNLDVEDISGSSDPNRSVILLGDDTGPYTLKNYISIPDMEFELNHNKRARIPVTISIPADAEPGGVYGSVLVKTVTQEANIASTDTETIPSSAIISRIGTLFFITIPGDVETEGALKDFTSLPKKSWYEKGPINFGITYENTGSLHLNPYGELRITNMFNEEVGFVELEPWFTLPQSVRLREVSWNRDLLYGRYTATIFLNRGYDDTIDEMSFTFWVIPWKIILGGLAVIFAIFFVIRGFFRKFEFKVKTK